MKRTRRIVSLVLSLALALCLLPAAAFAATVIDQVKVAGIKAPAAGKDFDFFGADTAASGYSVDYDYYENYYTAGVSWFDRTEERVVGLNEKAVSGHEYLVSVRLVPTGSNLFKTSGTAIDVTATVNGKPAEQITGDRKAVFLWYTFYCPIASVEVVGVTAPQAGSKFTYTANVNELWYQINTTVIGGNGVHNGMYWRDDTTARMIQDDETAQEGHEYQVVVALKPVGGREFAVDGEGNPTVSATVNGNAATKVSGAKNTIYVYYTFPTDKILGQVRLGISTPAMGNKPSFSPSFSTLHVAAMDHNITGYKNGVCWTDFTDRDNEVTLTANDTFRGGHWYRLGIRLVPKDGYKFRYADGDPTVSVICNSHRVDDLFGNASMIGFSQIYRVPGAEIPSVSVTIAEPAAGQKPSYEATPGSNCYALGESSGAWRNGVLWWDVTDCCYLGPSSVFEAGHTYRVGIDLNTADGCDFVTDLGGGVGSYAATTSLNGNFIPADELHGNCGSVYFYYTFPTLPEQPAPGAIASVMAKAEAGKTTVSWTASANAAAYIIQRRVKDTTTWTTLKSNVTGLSYDDATGVGGTVYQYRVRGRNGTSYGPFKVSSVVRAVAGTPTPGAISSVTATASAGRITVNWTAAENAPQYIIQRRVKDGTVWTTLKSNVNTTTYDDTAGTAGTVYQYRIRGRSGTSYGPFRLSSVARVIAGSSTTTKPGAISSVTAAPTAGKITVKWTASSGATMYLIQRQANGGAWTTLSTAYKSTAYSDTTVTKGNTYVYRVRGRNAEGYGDFRAGMAVTAV